jgi:hypothetical protein
MRIPILGIAALLAANFAALSAQAAPPVPAAPSGSAPLITARPASPASSAPQGKLALELHATKDYASPVARLVGHATPFSTGRVWGVADGTKLHVTVQTTADRVDLPAGERVPAPTASQRRVVNASFNAELARNVAAAVKEKAVFDLEGTRVDGPARPVVLEHFPPLAPKAPVTMTGRDANGRPLPTVRTTVVGAVRGRFARTGGEKLEVAEPWLRSENVLSTPAYEREGKSFVKILGLAAFPRNASIRVVNWRRLAENGENTPYVAYEWKASGPNASGSASIEIPAMPGDQIGIEVAHLSEPERNNGRATMAFFLVPSAKDAPASPKLSTNGGVPYLPIVLHKPSESRTRIH